MTNTKSTLEIILGLEANVQKRADEIRNQVEGLPETEKLSVLENMQLFFYKRLCRAQHALSKVAIQESRVLLAAVKRVTLETKGLIA